MNKSIFVVDLLHHTFNSEKELDTLLDGYPSDSVVLVSPKAKNVVRGFSGKYVSYIAGDQSPFYADKDLLQFHGESGDFSICDKYTLSRFGVLKND